MQSLWKEITRERTHVTLHMYSGTFFIIGMIAINDFGAEKYSCFKRGLVVYVERTIKLIFKLLISGGST